MSNNTVAPQPAFPPATAGKGSDRLLDALRAVVDHLAERLDAPIGLKLWDNKIYPLNHSGKAVQYHLSVNDPGAVGSILRRPWNLENTLMRYAAGQIDFSDDDIIDFLKSMRTPEFKRGLKSVNKWFVLRRLLPFLFVWPGKYVNANAYADDEIGRSGAKRKHGEFIQFHYDLSNEFYALWLDKEMQYTCAYFHDWENSLAQAQFDKMDLVARKLRLQPGERVLDTGCGWGGLTCHMAQHYGVHVHAVTLSPAQHEWAVRKVRELGLEDRVTVECNDFFHHVPADGPYDKIASIGMFEHMGSANWERYYQKQYDMLKPGGVMLHHCIARRAKPAHRRRHITKEKRLLLKYIFPGSELDDIGHQVEQFELRGFEVHDVEAIREHYALTCAHWARNLQERKDEAIRLVGAEKYRLWLLYLAGVSLGFHEGSMVIFQTLVTKIGPKGPSGLPAGRRDIYAGISGRG